MQVLRKAEAMNCDTRRLIERAVRELERLPEAGQWLIWGMNKLSSEVG
jgi:hypothetical protein